MPTCKKCAGTGEKFDMELEDWSDPLEDCTECNGTGESGKCPEDEHVPNRNGMCVVCGYEVVKEVDSNGIPLQEIEWYDERTKGE